MDPITWEEFYSKNAAPADFEKNKNLIESFCEKFVATDRRVVLITIKYDLKMSDPFEAFIELFNSQSEGFGINQERFVLDVRDLVLPVHIKWNFLGIISFLLSHPLTEHTEVILSKLLAMDKKVNNETGNVPALTALAFQGSNVEFLPVIARITRSLLEKRADPLFISRKTCKSRYTVPDALGMAVNVKCVPMVRQLLAYWWPSPVYILDSWTGHMPQSFHFWFPILFEYGLPHGENVCEDIEYFIESVIERGTEEPVGEWTEFKMRMRKEPTSLKRQARNVIRQKIGLNVRDGHEFYRTIEEMQRLPQALVNFLLLKEA